MGTLFDQKARDYKRVDDADVRSFLKQAQQIAKDLKIELRDVLEAFRIKEMARSSDLYVTNGDAFDEQIAGIGEILDDVKDSMGSISQSLNDMVSVKP